MQTAVNKFVCKGCGKCINKCPQIYEWNSFGKARPIRGTIPAPLIAACRLAASMCPVSAIIVNEEAINQKSFITFNVRRLEAAVTY